MREARLHFDIIIEPEVLISRKRLFQLDLLCLIDTLHEAFLADSLVPKYQDVKNRDLELVQFSLLLTLYTLPELGTTLVLRSSGVCLFDSNRHW